MTQTKVRNKYGVEVGDYFYTSWGYDQTNVDFYKVVRVTATKAELLPVYGRTADTEGQYEHVVPSDTPREYDVLTGINRDSVKRTKLCTVKDGWRGEPTIVLRSGEHWAHKWDGTPKYQTGYGFGH
jgi:hypothetical protein